MGNTFRSFCLAEAGVPPDDAEVKLVTFVCEFVGMGVCEGASHGCFPHTHSLTHPHTFTHER